MKALPRLPLFLCPFLFFTLPSCEELETGSSSSSLSSASSPSVAPPEVLTKHDAALRFLTAYTRLDRNMALRYAEAEAVAKLDWNRSHNGNIPYYDDKMILYFNGGWARVYFQEQGNGYRVSNLDVHKR